MEIHRMQILDKSNMVIHAKIRDVRGASLGCYHAPVVSSAVVEAFDWPFPSTGPKTGQMDSVRPPRSVSASAARAIRGRVGAVLTLVRCNPAAARARAAVGF